MTPQESSEGPSVPSSTENPTALRLEALTLVETLDRLASRGPTPEGGSRINSVLLSRITRVLHALAVLAAPADPDVERLEVDAHQGYAYRIQAARLRIALEMIRIEAGRGGLPAHCEKMAQQALETEGASLELDLERVAEACARICENRATHNRKITPPRPLESQEAERCAHQIRTTWQPLFARTAREASTYEAREVPVSNRTRTGLLEELDDASQALYQATQEYNTEPNKPS